MFNHISEDVFFCRFIRMHYIGIYNIRILILLLLGYLLVIYFYYRICIYECIVISLDTLRVYNRPTFQDKYLFHTDKIVFTICLFHISTNGKVHIKDRQIK